MDIVIKGNLNMPKHKHPHGVENTKPNDYRMWVCEECLHVFKDDEIRTDIESGIGYHICKSHPCRKGQRCESHLEPFMPNVLEVKDAGKE
jgi:hypothetical protein